MSTEPVLRYNIADVQGMYKRRHVMRDVGLEIYFPAADKRYLTAQLARGHVCAFVDRCSLTIAAEKRSRLHLKEALR